MLEVRVTPVVVLPRKDGSGVTTEFKFSVFDTDAVRTISPLMDQCSAITHKKLLEEIYQLDKETYQLILEKLKVEDNNNGE